MGCLSSKVDVEWISRCAAVGMPNVRGTTNATELAEVMRRESMSSLNMIVHFNTEKACEKVEVSVFPWQEAGDLQKECRKRRHRLRRVTYGGLEVQPLSVRWEELGVEASAVVMVFTAEEEWRELSSTTVLRYTSAAAALRGSVYVVGGGDGQGFLSCMERLSSRDPLTEHSDNTNRNDILPEMSCGRGYTSCGTLDERIWVVGGIGTAGHLASVISWAPGENTWRIEPPLPSARYCACVVPLEGQLYVLGGHDGHNFLNTAVKYRPETQTWTALPPMNETRYTSGAVAINGNVYIVGGGNGSEPSRTLEKFSPDTQEWTYLPSMPEGRCYIGAAAVGQELFVVGGMACPEGQANVAEAWVQLATVLSFDTVSQVWREVPPMTCRRYSPACCVLNGKLYAIGGHSGKDFLNCVEVFG